MMADEADLRSQLAALGEHEYTRRSGLLIALAELLDDEGRADESQECYDMAADATAAQQRPQSGDNAPKSADPANRPGQPDTFVKREYLGFEQRHVEPYVHHIADSKHRPARILELAQQPYTTQGFASTVWDSSIVLAKYLERHADGRVVGKRVLELGAGCGLASAAAIVLGARRVAATDLEENLPLLRANLAKCTPAYARRRVSVDALRWGHSLPDVEFDLVLGADLMYIDEAVPALIETLVTACAWTSGGVAIFAYGRNRTAEPRFTSAIRARGFGVRVIGKEELHPTYTCDDVTLLEISQPQSRS